MMTSNKQKTRTAPVKPLRLDGRTAREVHRGFGLDPARISFAESPEVEAMGTRAVARGNVISFAPGEFAPGTAEGRAVLGHELEHARGQAAGEVPMTGGVLEEPSFEAAADRAGAAFASRSLTAAGPVDAGALAGHSAPAQMKKKSYVDQIRDIQIPQARARKAGEKWRGYSPENAKGIFEGGTRASANPIMKEAGLPEVMAPFRDQSKDLIKKVAALKKMGGERHTFEGGASKYSAESAAVSEKMFQMIMPHLDDPEVQGFIKDTFANMGGNFGATDQSPKGYFMTDVLARMTGVVNGQAMRSAVPADSFDSRNHPANIAGDAGQVGNYFSEWLSENDRDADFQSMMAPELWPAFQAFIPYYDKVWSIGAPNIRPEILEKTGLELPAPAPEAAPYHFSPGGEKTAPNYMSAELPGQSDANEMSLDQRMKQARLMMEKHKGNKEMTRAWADIMGGLQKESNPLPAPAAPKKSRNPFKRLWSKIRGN